MGTSAHVVVTAATDAEAEELVHHALARLTQLHDRWTRFDPDSEVGRLNRAGGAPVAVSEATLDLVEHMVRAWRRTHGAFDPTVLTAMTTAGYDRDFAVVSATPTAAPAPRSSRPSPGCDGIEIDRDAGTVRVPVGAGIDPGGIAKGLAADLVVAALRTGGAIGACVNVGGDLRVQGCPPDGDGWVVELRHPLPDRPRVANVRIHDGAVASSWRTRRAWGEDADRRHHLLDPATGQPAWTGLAGVSVIASTAWWAEALAKAAFLAGPEGGAAVVDEHGAAGFLIRDDGAWRAVGDVSRFVA